MQIHETLKNEGNNIKTISLGEGLRYDLSCTPRAFLIYAKLKVLGQGHHNHIISI